MGKLFKCECLETYSKLVEWVNENGIDVVSVVYQGGSWVLFYWESDMDRITAEFMKNID